MTASRLRLLANPNSIGPAQKLIRREIFDVLKYGGILITRGHYLGEIIDDLSVLGSQVKMRNALGYTDLTVYAENFFRDVLNILLDIHLSNLNSERSNEPGLDLGDKRAKLAFQITSSAGSTKINETIKKINSAQSKAYSKFIVLGMNKRQRSYTLDPVWTKKHSFTEENIWDLDTLARKAVGLELDPLRELHRLIRSDSARLKVELELPDADGKYPTNGFDLWEERVKPKIGDGNSFCKFWEGEVGQQLTQKEREQMAIALKKLGFRLSRLPRLTREFLAMLYERREKGTSKRFKDEWSHLLLGKVQREFHGDDLQGELDILVHADFILIDDEDPYEQGPTEIGLRIPGDCDELSSLFVEFVVANKLNFRKVIGAVDLSGF